MKNLTDYNDFVESKKILESKKEEEKEVKDKKSEKDEEKDEKKEEKDEKSDDSSKSDEDKYLTAGQKKLPAGLKASLIKKAKKTGKVAESLEEEIEAVMESAQLFDNTWKFRSRMEIPNQLINAYVKKVEQETGEQVRQKWSDQEVAEEIGKYITASFLSIENLPSNIISSSQKAPQVQTQEAMPTQTQVQAPVQEAPVQSGQTQGEVQSQDIAQEIPQTQGQVQGQAPAQGGQAQVPAQGGQAQAPAQPQGI